MTEPEFWHMLGQHQWNKWEQEVRTYKQRSNHNKDEWLDMRDYWQKRDCSICGLRQRVKLEGGD